jgi:quercetin dioxygenase-like cupin family protein
MVRPSKRHFVLVAAVVCFTAQSCIAFDGILSKSVTMDRNMFSPSSFVFDLTRGVQLTASKGVVVQLGDVSSFPALGLPDNQMALARIFMKEGAVVPTHVHPRGTEMPYVVKGLVQVTLEPEFGGKGKIVNTLTPGQSTIFPAGVAHGQKCVKGPCEFVAVFNSPDPGIFFATVNA